MDKAIGSTPRKKIFNSGFAIILSLVGQDRKFPPTERG